jgi:NADH:ubiquinone reductase (H+-translocating)
MRLVIAGGGFAGFWAAAAAARVRRDVPSLESLDIVLVSRDDQLTIRPRLYEPNPSEMAVPLIPRSEAIGVRFVQGEIRSIDVTTRQILMADNGPVSYDRLVLATGSQVVRPPGTLGAQGFDIDTLAGAAALERHLVGLASTAQSEGRWTVVIAGGGFTGIELATALAERLSGIAGKADIRIILVDRASQIGASLGTGPSDAIASALAKAGIEQRTSTTIADADRTSVTLSTGERISSQTLVWTTGMRANPLAAQLSSRTDDLGRIEVAPELRVAGANQVFAAGDVARALADDGHPVLQSCQHAQSTGKFAGYNAAADLAGLPLLAYRQPLYTTCLDLGASDAVLTLGWGRQVLAGGADAKRIKRMINTQLIYPAADRESILASASPTVLDEDTFKSRILSLNVSSEARFA